ncbi:MAG: ROK family transcriptional regulator [Planctomycetaceae bacterium]|nr:ROK family transcriptional regulator [Planctomycetaceae bacterium]
MSANASAQPQLLSRLNERSVMRVLQDHGPCSRADVSRRMNTSAPTVSKAVASLLRAGLLEEFDVKENGRGRPAKQLRLASETAQVLGLVIDAAECRIVVAGMDGVLRGEGEVSFETPKTYDRFLREAVHHARRFINSADVTTLGLGISVPGLLDYRKEKGLLSPNVPMTNGHSPSRDLSERLGINCVVLQETHALCLAERRYGAAQKLNDFGMLDISTGLGLGIISSGRLLTGHSGLAGEIGHIPIEENGRLCGCGARGCLETVASDSALAWLVSERLGRRIEIGEIVAAVGRGELSVQSELDLVCKRLAFALATVINLFNPATLFVYGRLFELEDDLFARVCNEARRRSLGPSFADCELVRARGSKRQGAIAGIIEYLTDSLVPDFPVAAAGIFQDNASLRENGMGRR